MYFLKIIIVLHLLKLIFLGENNKKKREIKRGNWIRVLHATSVYANLLQFRKKMLNEIDNNDFKEFYKEACNSGEKSFNHLLNSLYEKIDYFDVDGINIIEKY